MFRRPILFLAALSFLIRLPYLGVLPPGGDAAFFLRLPSALSGVLSVVLVALIVEKYSGEKSWGLWTGVVLSLMPWHIEQSRIYSPALIGLTVVLSAVYAVRMYVNSWVRWVSALAAGVVLAWAFPSVSSLLFLRQPVPFWDVIDHIGSLLSGEFFFYKNESFWTGGFRTVGVFLPFTAGILIAGIYGLLPRVNKKLWPWGIGFLTILCLSAANPTFPEGSLYFLATPLFAAVAGLGVQKLWTSFRSSSMLWRILLVGYACLLVYEYIVFFHFYVGHYSPRIGEEIPYEQRIF